MRLDLVCLRVLNFLPQSTQVDYMIRGVVGTALRGFGMCEITYRRCVA